MKMTVPFKSLNFVKKVSDINVAKTIKLPSPEELIASLPRTPTQGSFVAHSRDAIHRIIFGNDKRLLMVVGPCSIHDVEAGREYAQRFAKLAADVADRLLLVMRVYFEKPRTTVGWKGLIMDPHLDGTYDIPAGLKLARKFLQEVVDLGIPTATELLDPITPQYISDLISWSAVGARTTESQTHRQMASGLSMPLGFKNGTDGNIQVAINAIKAASSEQTFLGIDTSGYASAVTTRGNPNCHIVLRGGANGPNFDAAAIEATRERLVANHLTPAIMVDASHENSGKKPELQPQVLESVVDQICSGADSIIGMMVESNLHGGNQSFPRAKNELQYGVSITDACIDWETTENSILLAYKKLSQRF